MPFFLFLINFGFGFFSLTGKKYCSDVLWSEVVIKKYFSSALKLIPTVKASLFSSKISSSSLVFVPSLCLKIFLGLWNSSSFE